MEEQCCCKSQKGDSNPLWRSNHVPLFVELLSACSMLVCENPKYLEKLFDSSESSCIYDSDQFLHFTYLCFSIYNKKI